jgi:uncharacterized membrane protein YfcA
MVTFLGEFITDHGLFGLGLVLLGMFAYIISTVGAGGGALMTIPGVSAIVGTQAVAPIVNLGAFLGRPSRFWLFRKTIDWKIVLYYLPASATGSFLAAYFFTKSPIDWLQILIGLFLISTLFQYKYGKKRATFPMQRIYFVPIGFVVSLVGTFTGGMGPVQNPFYLNLKLSKETMIGTKTANSFFMGLFQLIGYSAWGLFSNEMIFYGICLGIGATIGNIIGKRIVVRISEKVFLRFVLAIMVISGVVLTTKGILTIL